MLSNLFKVPSLHSERQGFPDVSFFVDSDDVLHAPQAQPGLGFSGLGFRVCYDMRICIV